jgi:hypothetical protein
MKTKVIVGRIVHTISTSCPSVVNRLIIGEYASAIIIYITTTVIIVRIMSTWSWKKISCSIRGEEQSWFSREDQVDINRQVG